MTETIRNNAELSFVDVENAINNLRTAYHLANALSDVRHTDSTVDPEFVGQLADLLRERIVDVFGTVNKNCCDGSMEPLKYGDRYFGSRANA